MCAEWVTPKFVALLNVRLADGVESLTLEEVREIAKKAPPPSGGGKPAPAPAPAKEASKPAKKAKSDSGSNYDSGAGETC
jgi:hypothetical protein